MGTQGEQHDMVPYLRDFLNVYKQTPNALNQLHQAINERLPPVRVLVPIDLGGGRTVNIRVAEGDNVQEVAKEFAAIENLPDDAIPKVVRAINQRLYPGSMQL